VTISIFEGLLPADDFDLLLAGLAKQRQTPRVQDPIVNEVTVVISDNDVFTTPSFQLTAITATESASIADFGRQSNQIVTILAEAPFAVDLAEYLIRPLPEYWFSSIEVLLNGVPDGVRGSVAELEIGDQIRVSKRFPKVADPVVQELFVEGVEHEITVDRHTVRLYCSPAALYELFLLDTSELDDPAFGLG
jgi:hypothetical protein